MNVLHSNGLELNAPTRHSGGATSAAERISCFDDENWKFSALKKGIPAGAALIASSATATETSGMT